MVFIYYHTCPYCTRVIGKLGPPLGTDREVVSKSSLSRQGVEAKDWIEIIQAS